MIRLVRDLAKKSGKEVNLEMVGEDTEIDRNLVEALYEPTAQEITDVSGRGVGMDVVKSGIEKFRGQLNIAPEKTKGTKFTISD